MSVLIPLCTRCGYMYEAHPHTGCDTYQHAPAVSPPPVNDMETLRQNFEAVREQIRSLTEELKQKISWPRCQVRINSSVCNNAAVHLSTLANGDPWAVCEDHFDLDFQVQCRNHRRKIALQTLLKEAKAAVERSYSSAALRAALEAVEREYKEWWQR